MSFHSGPRPHDAPAARGGRVRAFAGLLVCFAVCFAASAVGAIASANASEFYGQLAQPTWAPPAWLFGPVWTVLYATMAVALWLVVRRGGVRAHAFALALFCVQLVLNGLWSWLFFAWRAGGWAFLDVIVLWAAIAATLVAFWRIRRIAGWLLLPYLLWVSYAAALNYELWRGNPALLGS